MSTRRAHFVLSTHWDREWHWPFQEFRYYLVRLMDRVIAGLQDGRLVGPFQTDGQAIIIEDYLEVRPERREEVKALVQQRKLVVGPWYVMPDEFTVSGEALVRNLRLGREAVRALGGEPSDAGYVCDMFGHNSQMPQILAGFGILGALVWRGANTIEHRNFIWRGADGTELPSYRFGAVGYGSYAHYVRRAHEREREVDAATMAEHLDALLDEEARWSDVDPILLLDGCDHQEWDEPAYAVLLTRMDRSGGPYEIVHTSFDEYLAEMRAQKDRIRLVLEGELREPALYPVEIDNQWLIPGVLSSRVNLKQANSACQTLLCHWAEPLGAFAHAALGLEYPQGFLDVAWRWLLQNHPHDSMDGCSADQVHKDMEYRFDQCLEIASRLTTEATHHLAASVEGEVGDRELRVVAFNPLLRDFDGVAELTIQVPAHWPCFNEFFAFEPKPAFRGVGSPQQPVRQRREQDILKHRRPVRIPVLQSCADSFSGIHGSNTQAEARGLSGSPPPCC